jgi:predicted dinucleotide-binding enzyme
VVKAFNTLFAQVLADGFRRRPEGQRVHRGDDAAAKQTVQGLAETMGFPRRCPAEARISNRWRA